jgi:hypothetical protein
MQAVASSAEIGSTFKVIFICIIGVGRQVGGSIPNGHEKSGAIGSRAWWKRVSTPDKRRQPHPHRLPHRTTANVNFGATAMNTKPKTTTPAPEFISNSPLTTSGRISNFATESS